MNTNWFYLPLFLLITLPIHAQSDDNTEQVIADMMKEREVLKSIEAEASALREKIASEIESIGDHPWAGRYYYGDGLGANVSLTLAPENGFAYTWHGCLGIYAANYGTIIEKDGRLELSLAIEEEEDGMKSLARSFTVVPWDERVYLIPSDEMIDFCNEINLGREPRKSAYGFQLLRKGDEQKPVSGKPSVPEEYLLYILDEPIETSVTSVGEYSFRGRNADYQFKDTEVTLDKGSDDGLLPGMEFFIDQSVGIHEDITIKEVSEQKSTGVITQTPGNYHEIKVGWKFRSTAWFYR